MMHHHARLLDSFERKILQHLIQSSTTLQTDYQATCQHGVRWHTMLGIPSFPPHPFILPSDPGYLRLLEPLLKEWNPFRIVFSTGCQPRATGKYQLHLVLVCEAQKGGT